MEGIGLLKHKIDLFLRTGPKLRFKGLDDVDEGKKDPLLVSYKSQSTALR